MNQLLNWTIPDIVAKIENEKNPLSLFAYLQINMNEINTFCFFEKKLVAKHAHPGETIKRISTLSEKIEWKGYNNKPE